MTSFRAVAPPHDRPAPCRATAPAIVTGEPAVSPELIAIIGAAIALAAVILPGQHAMRRDIADLRERMARLEGLFEGFTRCGSAPPTA